MLGGGAGGSILNLGQAALDRLCQQATWGWQCLRAGKKLVGTWGESNFILMCGGHTGSFSGGDIGGTEVGLLGNGWEGERCSRRELNWGRGLEVGFVSWVG